MKSEISTLSLFLAAASAFPAAVPAPETLCGPDSNCEIVTINGTKSIHFKAGMEPGSADHFRRFYMHPRPRDEKSKAELKVIMGETKMQWGCGTDVKGSLKDAINENCRAEAGCDSGKKKNIKVDKWEGKSDEPTEAELNIRVDAKYYDQEMRDMLQKAMEATGDKGVEGKEEEWWVQRSASANHWGMSDQKGKCKVNNFPNYVAINRFEDKNLKDYMEIHAELVEGEKNCLGATVIGAIAGAINPMAGRLFGFAKVLCESEL